jgi:DNA-directed RNA polymerase specialized sigma subunit
MDSVPLKKPTLDSMHADWVRTQDIQHMHQMLDTLSPDIDKAIYAYSGLNAGPAVKTRAKLLAAKAIKSYQPSSGSSLKSWVYTQLQPLTRYSRELAPAPIPERAYQQLSSLKKMEADFYENKGRVPSDAELADLTSMSMRQINKIRGMDKKVFSESATPFSGDNSASSQEITATQNTGFQKDVLDTMYSSFTPQEQVIVEHKLGYNGKKILSNNDIAKKLKVSPGRVSQMTTNIAAQLDEYANLNKGMM